MKTIVPIILLIAVISLLFTACGGQKPAQSTASTTQAATSAAVETKKAPEPTVTATEASAQTQTQTIQATDAPVSTEAPQEEQTEYVEEQPQEEQNMTLNMSISGTPVSVVWEENDAVQALRELCREQPLSINMSMYGGFEQVGAIGANLPQDDVRLTTSPGDIVLYSGDQMVVFYGSNTWAYTRLGHIADKTEDELTALLSGGDITITLTVQEVL